MSITYSRVAVHPERLRITSTLDRLFGQVLHLIHAVFGSLLSTYSLLFRWLSHTPSESSIIVRSSALVRPCLELFLSSSIFTTLLLLQPPSAQVEYITALCAQGTPCTLRVHLVCIHRSFQPILDCLVNRREMAFNGRSAVTDRP